LHLGMVGKPPQGGWFHNFMMRLCSSLRAIRDEFFLSWGLPSIWFSLLLESLYVQKNMTLCSSFYWHLAFFQIVWDEAKGKYPLVYDDVFSKTILFVLLNFSRDICMLVWCIGSCVRPNPYL